MTTARWRSSGTRVLFRPLLLTAAFALGASLAGCFRDDLSGRILRPPSDGNNSAFSYGSVAVGGTMNCLLTNGGGARCWGQGRLGDGRTTDSDRLVRVSGAVVFAELSVAGPGACGITTNGVAMCWGSNFWGGLGNGSLEPSDIPVEASTQERFSAIHASGLSACAVSVEGAAFCWGANRQGELGIASGDTMALVPEPVVGGLTFTRIALTFGHTCAITQEGAPYCWGRNWGPTPQPVPTAARFTTIDAGSGTFCGLTGDGDMWCWGSNRAGLFANGEMDGPESDIYHTVPIQAVTDLRFSKLSVGDRHSCAIEIEREEAYCWGSDDTGQLGDGTPPSGTDDEFKLSPSRVGLSRRFVDIGAKLGTSCAATTEGEAYCWGWRTGNAANPVSDVPVGVG